jgi:chemotaxis protein MotA
MFAILGMLVVLAAVIGGFLMEHGPIRVLMQPSELVIIAGAAAGTLLVANPLHTLKGIVSGVLLVLTGSKFNKQRYLDALKMMYDLFGKVFRGVVTMTFDDPNKKPVKPTMTHFFYMDKRDPSKVSKWYGAVGPTAF